jgi:signal transduction histidine kinase
VALLALVPLLPAADRRSAPLRRAIAAGVLALCLWAVLSGETAATGDRMAPASAALLALAALLRLTRPGRAPALALATLGLALTLFALESWILDLAATQSVQLLTGLSLPTALCLALLFAEPLMAAPTRGWLALTLADGLGGRTARTVLPLSLLLPFLGAWLAILASRQGLVPVSLLLTASAMLLALVSAALVLWLARSQHRAERAAARQGQRIAAVLEALPEAVLLLDAGGRVMGSNRAARALAGPEGDVAAWLARARFLDPEAQRPLAPAARPLPMLVTARRRERLLVALRDPGAGLRLLLFCAAPLRGPGAPPGGLALTVTDQSDSAALQDRRARAQHREALGALAGGVAHELSNVLGVVRLAADTGLLKREAPALRRALETVREACDRGSDLTRRLMVLGAEPEADAPPDDARALLDHALRLIRLSVPAQITLEADLPPAGLGAVHRGTELQTALLALVLNARNALLEAGRAEGRILVSARRERAVARAGATGRAGAAVRDGAAAQGGAGGREGAPEREGAARAGGMAAREGSALRNGAAEHDGAAAPGAPAERAAATDGARAVLVLRVRDDGPGMSAAVRARATEPFFTTRQDRGAAGLGLSQTAALARRMGGSLRLVSEPGQGTEAVLRLPLADASDPAAPPDPGAPAEAGAARLEGASALVVEDDEAFRAMMAEALRLMGLRVTAVAGAEAALAALEGAAPLDLLITDIRLGEGIDGHRLAALARARRPALPVLYVSGQSESDPPPERVVPGLVLRKPSSIEALRRAVSRSLHA